ncbi:MAG: VTT domain-containing protein [Candidatus Pacebacteria bacterium]|jgi:membrane-associated protein|nr:VTT domain-containing protein [Candidatus Paceibacterota bacterium]
MPDFLHIDIASLVQAFGLLGLLVIVFVESGVFFGFFFPGDSLLFTAGLLASQGFLNIWALLLLVPLAAILGVNFGYWFGKKVGQKLFTREDSFFFDKQHIERTRAFYAKHGVKAIVLSRFTPVVRTFTPILAGVGEMPYKIFMKFNILGGLLWTTSMLGLGYSLGTIVPDIDTYLLPIVLLIIFISFLPVIREVVKNKQGK